MKNSPSRNKIINFVIGKLERDRGNHDYRGEEIGFSTEIREQNGINNPNSQSSVSTFFLFLLVALAVIITVSSVVLYNHRDLMPFITDSRPFKAVVRFVDNINNPSRIREHSIQKNVELSERAPVPSSQRTDSSNEYREYNFSAEQVSRAQRNLLESRNKSKYIGNENKGENFPIEPFKDDKHRYEIELLTGRHVYADSVIVTDDKVTFENKRGLVISVSKNEIKALRKLN